MANRFSVDTVFRGIDHMSGVFGPMSAKAKAFEKSLKGSSQSATDLVEKPLGALQRAGALAAGGVAVAGAGIIEVMKTGMTFEKALLSAGNKFEAGISKSSDTFQRLKATAQDVGGSTEFSATQAAYGLKELAGAGLSADQAIAALRGTVDLATAAEIPDMAQATEVAVKSLGAFGLKSKNAAELADNLERVSDVMVKTDDVSSTSVLAFYEAIAEGGAVAKTAGANIETYGALVAGLSDIEQGGKAGTTLKNMFLTLSAPTKEAGDQFKKFGIKTTDSLGNTRDAIDVLDELSAATAKLGTGDRAGVLEHIFGKIPLAGVMTLLSKLPELRENRDALLNSKGSVKKKSESMRSGGTGAWDNFTSGLEAVSLAVFDLVGEPMTKIINRMTEWIGTNRDFLAGNISDYLNKAIPIVEAFGDGVYDSFLKAEPVIIGVKDALLSVFGGDDDSSPRTKAYQLSSAVTDATLVLGGLWLVTKAASAATFVYGAVTKGVTALVWLWEVAVGAAKAALFWYDVWAKAGTASTLAMSGASVIATGNLVRQTAATAAAAIGWRGLAGAMGVAGVALLSYMAIQEANDDLKKQTGGKGILDLTWGAITEGKGFFTQADEELNKQARARALKERGPQKAADAGATAADPSALGGLDPSADPAAFMKQLAALNAASGVLPPGMAIPGMPGVPLAPAGPPPAPGSKTAEPQVALKDESSAKLSQNLSRDIATNLKGSIKIEIKDKGGNADVSSSTGPGVEVNQSGGF